MREGSIVDIDEEAFANAAALLGTSGWSDTINAALREVGRIRRRKEAFDLLAEMGDRPVGRDGRQRRFRRLHG